jgi:hypothetical protein
MPTRRITASGTQSSPPACGQPRSVHEMHLLAPPGCFTPTEKLENCFSIRPLQSGHTFRKTSADFCRTSSTRPHFPHLYSNIGINSLPNTQKQSILTPHDTNPAPTFNPQTTDSRLISPAR